MNADTHVLRGRDIPVPQSVSPEAQQALEASKARVPLVVPAGDASDDEWLACIEAKNTEWLTGARDAGFVLDPNATELLGVSLETKTIDGFTIYVATPPGQPADDARLYLFMHGGGWVFGGGILTSLSAAFNALRLGVRVWSIDYRMPPRHPFPAPLDDCVAAYREALVDRDSADIIVGGDSAGGNLAAALILRLHDEEIPLPAAVALNTPATDLTLGSDTIGTNAGVDPTLDPHLELSLQYARDVDLQNPYVSPVFGELGPWFPPTILLSGTRDLLLSDTVRFHRALRSAGATADLNVFEAQGHAGFGGPAPEVEERAQAMADFITSHWRP